MLGFTSLFCFSSIEDYHRYQLSPTSSNYGETGLLEIPSARFMGEGGLKLGISASYPHEYTYMVASPFSWLEATYRYAEQKNLKYGPSTYSGNQTNKDKGFDVKVKLLNESYYLPNIAIGIRDIGGTGVFAGEYIVGSKRFKQLDVSIGLGWGSLGQAGNIKNPLISLDERFMSRGSNQGEGGKFMVLDWFSGERSAVFGGLEYSLQRYGLNFKVEYDTTFPDLGYSGPALEVNSRFNFGVTRSLGEWIDLGLSYERGSQVRFSFTMKGFFGEKELVPKIDSPKKVIPLNKAQKDEISSDKRLFYRSLNRSLREESLYIQGATYKEDSIDVLIGQTRFRSYPRAVGRAARITSALSPDEVKKLNIVMMNGDLEVSSILLDREEFDKANNYNSSPLEILLKSKLSSVEGSPTYLKTDFRPTVIFPDIRWSMSPALKHQIGGPEAFYLGQLWWRVNTTLVLRRGLSMHSILGFNIYNNFDEFGNPSSSSIPHVRSDLQDYLSEGENNIARLKLDYLWSPRKDWFARLDIGLLEEMFGGYGGEVYYRPFNSNFSTSFTLHHVKQRGYKQRFKFRDYQTDTGHLGLYYDWPKGVQTKLLIGKYLAGDKGATLDLARRFDTGFTVGVFATKTNLSEKEFGEGSFDKGFYFSIPMDLFYTKYGPGNISFGLHPLTKDGGALLNHQNSLYGLLGGTNRGTLLRDWKNILD